MNRLSSAAIGISALALSAGAAHATAFTYTHVTIPPTFIDVVVTGGPPAAPKLIGDGMIILQKGSHELGTYQQLLALCIDPLNPHFLTNSGTYDYAPPPATFTHTQIGQIGALLEYAVDNYQSDPLIAAAAQLDIWRIGYPTVTFAPQSIAVRNEAVSIDGLNLPPVYTWFALLDADKVGQELGTPGIPLSEPSSFALLGIAFMSFFFWRYSRQRAQAQATLKVE